MVVNGLELFYRESKVFSINYGKVVMMHSISTHDTGDTMKFQAIEAAKIRHFYSQPHLLPARDQHCCDCSLIQLLRSRPAHRRRWLMRVRRARAELLSKQHRQVQITSYFTTWQLSKDHNSLDTATHLALAGTPTFQSSIHGAASITKYQTCANRSTCQECI